MSLWADAQIKMLLRKVEELENRVTELEIKEPEIVFPSDKVDKRTKEWRNQKAA